MRKLPSLPSMVVDPIIASSHDALYWDSSLNQFQQYIGIGKVDNIYLKVPDRNLVVSKRFLDTCDPYAFERAILLVLPGNETRYTSVEYDRLNKLSGECDDAYHLYLGLFDEHEQSQFIEFVSWLDSEVGFVDMLEKNSLADLQTMDQVMDSLNELCLMFLRTPLKERLVQYEYHPVFRQMLENRTDLKHFALRTLVRLLLDTRPERSTRNQVV